MANSAYKKFNDLLGANRVIPSPPPVPMSVYARHVLIFANLRFLSRIGLISLKVSDFYDNEKSTFSGRNLRNSRLCGKIFFSGLDYFFRHQNLRIIVWTLDIPYFT